MFLLAPYRREAEFLIEEGAAPQDVDGALYKFGLAMGPLLGALSVAPLIAISAGFSAPFMVLICGVAMVIQCP